MEIRVTNSNNIGSKWLKWVYNLAWLLVAAEDEPLKTKRDFFFPQPAAVTVGVGGFKNSRLLFGLRRESMFRPSSVSQLVLWC